jgi:hypothetical protein
VGKNALDSIVVLAGFYLSWVELSQRWHVIRLGRYIWTWRQRQDSAGRRKERSNEMTAVHIILLLHMI